MGITSWDSLARGPLRTSKLPRNEEYGHVVEVVCHSFAEDFDGDMLNGHVTDSDEWWGIDGPCMGRMNLKMRPERSYTGAKRTILWDRTNHKGGIQSI